MASFGLVDCRHVREREGGLGGRWLVQGNSEKKKKKKRKRGEDLLAACKREAGLQ